MTDVLNTSVCAVSGVSALVCAGSEAVRTQAWKNLKLKFSAKEILPYLAFTGVLGAFTYVGVIQDTDYNGAWLAFIGAMLVPFLLARLRLPATLIGAILFACSLVFSWNIGIGNQVSSLAALGGLLTYKVIDQLFLVSETGFEDILPSMFFLSAASWFFSAQYVTDGTASKDGILQFHIVLCAISASFLLKAIPSNVLKNDPFFLKRLLVSLMGGFLMWILVSQILLAHKMVVAAILFGGSIFTHLLLNADSESSEGTSKYDFPIQFLVLVGVLTLVASRLLGMFGLLVIAPPALLCASSSAAVTAGMYWCTRALFQGFQSEYNGNVTGINLLHSYVSASVYAGISLAIVVASLWLRSVNTWRDSIVFLSLAFVLPPACNYFLHEEPSSGYLFTLMSAALVIVPLAKGLFAPALSKPKYPVMMLLPCISVITAWLTAGLFEAGNHSTLQARLYAAGAIAAVVAVTLIVSYFVDMNKHDKLQAKPAE